MLYPTTHAAAAALDETSVCVNALVNPSFLVLLTSGQSSTVLATLLTMDFSHDNFITLCQAVPLIWAVYYLSHMHRSRYNAHAGAEISLII